MNEPRGSRATLLVLYSPRLEDCRRFYGALGLRFTAEQHGRGPRHHAAVLADGTVFECCPARPGCGLSPPHGHSILIS